jgi:hypothetical protein
MTTPNICLDASFEKMMNFKAITRKGGEIKSTKAYTGNNEVFHWFLEGRKK